MAGSIETKAISASNLKLKLKLTEAELGKFEHNPKIEMKQSLKKKDDQQNYDNFRNKKDPKLKMNLKASIPHYALLGSQFLEAFQHKMVTIYSHFFTLHQPSPPQKKIKSAM